LRKADLKEEKTMNNHWLRRLVWVTLVATAAGVIPGSQAQAAGFLSLFRTDQTETATINPGDFRQIADAMQGKLKLVDIVNFGQLHFLSWPARKRLSPADVPGLKDFPAKTPPQSVPGYSAPKLERVSPTKIRFALRVRHINKLLTGLGGTSMLPQALEGKSFLFTAPAQLRATYSSKDKGPIIITQTLEPDLQVPDGVNLADVRDALMSVPGFPEGLKTQLAGVDDWKHTQLAVSSEGAAKEIRVNGRAALFIEPGPNEHDNMAPPEVQNLHKEVERVRAESGEPLYEQPGGRRSSTLIWRDGDVIFMLQGEVSLEQARTIAEMIK
jgi:hypothetical protein